MEEHVTTAQQNGAALKLAVLSNVVVVVVAAARIEWSATRQVHTQFQNAPHRITVANVDRTKEKSVRREERISICK